MKNKSGEPAARRILELAGESGNKKKIMKRDRAIHEEQGRDRVKPEPKWGPTESPA